MKNYLVFSGITGYGFELEVGGGWADFKAAFETEQQALSYALNDFQAPDGCAWFEVVDLVSEKVIHCGGFYIEGAFNHVYEQPK